MNSFRKQKVNHWRIYLSKIIAENDMLLEKTKSNPVIDKISNIKLIPSCQITNVYRGSIIIDSHETTVYLKEYLYKNILDAIKHLIKRNHAKRVALATELLSSNGLNAPEILIYGWKAGLPFSNHFFTVAREISDSKSVSQTIRKFESENTDITIRRKFYSALGKEIGKLHAKNISHGDLRSGNILVQENNGDWIFYYIDNERTQGFKQLPMKLRIKNLVQVNMLRSSAISRTDRLRFFKEYIRENKSINTKEIISIVHDTTYKRLIKLLNQGRRNKNDIKI